MTTARGDRPRRARATPTTIRTTTTPSPCPKSRAAHEKQSTRAGALAERRSAHTERRQTPPGPANTFNDAFLRRGRALPRGRPPSSLVESSSSSSAARNTIDRSSSVFCFCHMSEFHMSDRIKNISTPNVLRIALFFQPYRYDAFTLSYLYTYGTYCVIFNNTVFTLTLVSIFVSSDGTSI